MFTSAKPKTTHTHKLKKGVRQYRTVTVLLRTPSNGTVRPEKRQPLAQKLAYSKQGMKKQKFHRPSRAVHLCSSGAFIILFMCMSGIKYYHSHQRASLLSTGRPAPFTASGAVVLGAADIGTMGLPADQADQANV